MIPDDGDNSSVWEVIPEQIGYVADNLNVVGRVSGPDVMRNQVTRHINQVRILLNIIKQGIAE